LSDEALADMAEARRLGTPNPGVYRIFDHHPALRRSFTEHWRVMVDDGLADRPAPDRPCGRLRDEEKLAASHTWRPSDVLDEREKAMLWLRARLTRRAVSGAGAAPAGAGPPTSDDGGAAP
jgi:hypothetical protein